MRGSTDRTPRAPLRTRRGRLRTISSSRERSRSDVVAEDALGLDLDDHAIRHVAPVLARVLAGELVHVLGGTAELELGGAFHLEVPVRIGGIEHGDADPRVAGQLLALRTRRLRVEDDVLAVRVDPDEARVRHAVRAQRGDRAEALL